MKTGSSTQGTATFALPGAAVATLDRGTALGIESAEIDQERVGAGDEGRDLLGRDRHRRDRAGREQHFAVIVWATELVMQCTLGARL